MSQLRLNDVNTEAALSSALTSSLMKLAQTAGAPVQQELKEEPQSFDWHSRWAANQHQISRRLKLIESELTRMAVQDIGPHLALFPEDVQG